MIGYHRFSTSRLKVGGAHLPFIGIALLCACAVGPAPIVIHDDPRLAVRVQYDPQSGTGHSHPPSLSQEQIARILDGILVSRRDPFGLGGLFLADEAVPAFAPSEVALLTPHVLKAFEKASPKDLVTFHLIALDQERRKLVTSGGLFVRDGRLYIILANFRTAPSSGPFEGMAYEMDNRDEPLAPIARYRFTVGFRLLEAWIPNSEVRGRDGYGGYIDDTKQLVIDLVRFTAPDNPASSRTAPPADRSQRLQGH